MKHRLIASRTSLTFLGGPAPHAAGRRFISSTTQRPAEVGGPNGGPNGGDDNGGLNARWLSDFQTRLKRLSSAELPPASEAETVRLQREIDTRWLDLLAGSDGFLTSQRWRGLDNHAVAWGDMDSMVSHVNNVIYNKYAESARVEWVRKFTAAAAPEHRQQWADLMTPRNIGLIMRSIKTEYKLPVTYPDRVTVLHKLTSRPDYTSDALYFDVMILSDAHRRLAAKCYEDIVVYDYKAAKRVPLAPFMVDRLQETFDLQEENQVRCREDVRRMFGSLERLEQEM